MSKFLKISNLIVLGLLILLCGLNIFYRSISFGHGLGDVIGFVFLYVGTLMHLILTFALRKSGVILHFILTLVFTILSLLIILNATIWRGSEYKWDGSIFYLPCSSKIQIRNKNIQKDVYIQMCSMEYYSEFTGTWDGRYITIYNGEIKVPKELEKYILWPIDQIEIVPEYYEKLEGDQLNVEYKFNPDTLMKGKRYEISGEIEGVVNSKPVMKVNIK